MRPDRVGAILASLQGASRNSPIAEAVGSAIFAINRRAAKAIIPAMTSAAVTALPRPASEADPIASLEALERRALWLSTWMIHNANHLRPNRDGLKVGGHQASCASSRHAAGRPLRPCRQAGGPGRGEAPCRARLPRPHVSHGRPEPRGAGALPRLRAACNPIPRAPRTQRRSISPRARWGWAWASPSSPAWCRIISRPMACSAARPAG